MTRRIYIGLGTFRIARAGYDAFADMNDRTKISFAESRPTTRVRQSGMIASAPGAYPSIASAYFSVTFAQVPCVFFAIDRTEYSSKGNEPRGLIIGDYIEQMTAGLRNFVGTPYVGIVQNDSFHVMPTTAFPYGLPSGDKFPFLILGE